MSRQSVYLNGQVSKSAAVPKAQGKDCRNSQAWERGLGNNCEAEKWRGAIEPAQLKNSFGGGVWKLGKTVWLRDAGEPKEAKRGRKARVYRKIQAALGVTERVGKIKRRQCNPLDESGAGVAKLRRTYLS